MKRIYVLFTSLFFSLLVGFPTLGVAEDTDIYLHSAEAITQETRPNILFMLDNSGSMNEPIRDKDGNPVQPVQTRMEMLKQALDLMLDKVHNVNVGIARFAVTPPTTSNKAGLPVNAPIMFPTSFVDDPASVISGEVDDSIIDVSVPVANSSDDAEQNLGTGETKLTNPQLQMTQAVVAEPSSGIKSEVKISAQNNTAMEKSGTNELVTNKDNLILGTDPSNQLDILVGLRFEGLAIPKGATIAYADIKFASDNDYKGKDLELTIAIADNDGVKSSTGITGDASAYPFGTSSFQNSGSTNGYLSGETYPVDKKNFPLRKDSAGNPIVAAWKPPADLVKGQVITTPNISSLIQGIVIREGWKDNNGLALLLKRNPNSPTNNIGVYAFSTPPILRVYWSFQETSITNVASGQAKESGGSFLADREIRLGNEKQTLGPTLVGVRFTGVAVPPGAKISKAAITFTRQSEISSNEGGNNNPLNLKIYAEDIGNALAFGATVTTSQKPVSPRFQTKTDPIEWNTVEPVAAGKVLKTPDLSKILQKIIDRSDWKNNNSAVFLFEKNGNVNGFRRVVAKLDQLQNGNFLAGATIVPDEKTLPRLEVTFTAGTEQGAETDPKNLKQIVGVRFTSLEIPQGAEVTNAQLTFTSGSSTSEPAKLLIQAEDTDDAQPFTEEKNNISSRKTTTEKVTWNMEAGWTDGLTYTTPKELNLKQLVQAVVNRQGWCGGRNGMAFIISANNEESPLRIARSFDDNSDKAPVLKVEFDAKKIKGTGCVDQTYSGQVSADTDDAEEKLDTSERGLVILNSNVLELAQGGTQTSPESRLVGFRFQSIPISQKAEIVEAHLILNSRATFKTTPTTLSIKGELSTNAETFSSAESNLSGRKKTSSKIDWVLDPWVQNENYTSIDIAKIVQEIVNQAGWKTYNDLALFIDGSGRRDVTSFKANPALAPILKIRVKGRLGEGGQGDFLTVRRRLQRIAKKMEVPKGSLTAIVDALYESTQYFMGKEVDFGKSRHGSFEYLVSHPGTYEKGDLKTPEGCNVNVAPLNEQCADEEIQGDAIYKSPIESPCQNNHIVLLTDGLATKDTAAAKIKSLIKKDKCEIDFEDPEGASNPRVKISPDEECGVDLAEYVSTHDVLTQEEIPKGGTGNKLTVHTIGFQLGTGWEDSYYIEKTGEKLKVIKMADGEYHYTTKGNPKIADDDKANIKKGPIENKKDTDENKLAMKFLKQMAKTSGGYFYEAVNAVDLVKAFEAIIEQAMTKSTSFAAPGISVSQFNNLLHDNEVYYALFEPSHNQLWRGNVKKFLIGEDDKLMAQNGPALSGNSFDDNAQSFWSTEVDGPEITKGGAGEQLLILGSRNRKIYTYLEDTEPGSDHAVDLTQYQIRLADDEGFDKDFDAALKSALAIENKDDSEKAEKVIKWIVGEEVNTQGESTSSESTDSGGENTGGEGEKTKDRWMFADPLHASPKAVTYGGTKDHPITKLFAATNDGLLHMLDAGTGKEDWAFLPRELLSRQPEMMENQPGERLYGLDSTPTFWYKDDDNNKNIDIGSKDFLKIYVGMRRGGRNLYALDVTDPSKPILMWTITGGKDEFEKLGQTWSAPLPVEVDPSFCESKESPCVVLLFGGGYDPSQDKGFDPGNVEMGNAIFMVDAKTGKRLWWVSNEGADLNLDKMKYPIPSDLFLVDANGDGWKDRIYVGDTGGQVWRIDLINKNDSKGGLRANISDPADQENHRRFFYAPMWVKIGKFELLAAVTGTRPDPLGTDVHDQFYVFNDLPWDKDQRDKDQLKTWTQDNMVEIINNVGDESDKKTFFVDENVNQQGGWYFNLDLSGGKNERAWNGEKGLTTPIVIKETVYFATYVPPQTTSDLCTAFDEGQSWLYAFNLLSGGATDKLANQSEEGKGEGKGGTEQNPLAIPGPTGAPTLSTLVRKTGIFLMMRNKNPLRQEQLQPNRIFWMQQE
ncbi:type IV pilin biogenesis protein [Thioploca ingrica]|uniref:Type IV pilin biogenesis protein n=1 Tax=Thioploca ingrica TaxID=40754 RepID=A0A090AN99_9GAMM|nr:type IV pilin biogenesis protein [Thioploca ingrica]